MSTPRSAGPALTALLLAGLMGGCTVDGDADTSSTTADSAAANGPVCPGDNDGLTGLPDGFCALLVAEDVDNVRHIAVAPNGDILAARASGRSGSGSGGIAVLRDTTGDGVVDARSEFGPAGGTGIWLEGETLYFATDEAVLRYTLPAGAMEPSSPPDTIVSGMPTGGHSAKSIAVSDGSLFVNIGSRTNSCQRDDRAAGSPGIDPCTELETRAGIWRFPADTTGLTQADGQRYATGLRNVVALTVHPQTGAVWGAQHGRDQLYQNWGELYDVNESAELPAEELMMIGEGSDFGWPYCYYDHFQQRRVLAPEYGGDKQQAGRCTEADTPVAAFPGHWAPNGLLIYDGDQFPARYRGGAFIAFHGSWNRAPLPQQGYNLVFQPLQGSQASGSYSVFADGFQRNDARPMGLAVGPDGSLYVSDDAGGHIWRILYRSGS